MVKYVLLNLSIKFSIEFLNCKKFVTNNQPTVTAHVFHNLTPTKPTNDSKNSDKKSKRR